MTETTNKEYRYETLPELEVILEQQYGQVHVQCMRNDNMVMWLCAMGLQQSCVLCAQISSYAVPLVEQVEEAVRKYGVSSNSVIDFGCGAGLVSFLLTTTFQKVHIMVPVGPCLHMVACYCIEHMSYMCSHPYSCM